MNKVCFAIGLHFHQPVGNFPHVLERAYQDCYRPFLETLRNYPDVKMTAHFSGSLLDYFEEKHPDFIKKLSGLVKDGQVEIMGGGYYEPIFPSIPRRDGIGQIGMMSDYIKKRFAVSPQGLWIPERVWTPDLAGLFCKTGLRYSILDNIHFIKAGVPEKELYGYYLTEYKDADLAVFSSIKKLRYDIPFKLPEETIDFFKRESKRGKNLLFTYGDDAEKFGMWPGTKKWVYEEGWLNKFFEALLKNRSFIELVTFSDFLNSNPPLGRIKIPEASYDEMLEWSGGSWNNFLSRYPESNHMHKKMWHVSTKIELLQKKKLRGGAGLLLERARRELYKGQCNCSYWHGLFGGIYLYHLRKATYEHLINADATASAIIHAKNRDWLDIEEVDFYKKKKKSFIVENSTFTVYIDPSQGGIIRELDYKPNSVNLVNTIKRSREPYHGKSGLKDKIPYDKYLKGCLLDHFLGEDVNREDFANCRYEEIADFPTRPYRAKNENKKLVLTRKGFVDKKPFLVSKKIQIESDEEIEISYTLKNISKYPVKTIFGVEFNLTMPYGDSDRYSQASGDSSFAIRDSGNELGVNLVFSLRPRGIWHFPLETVSRSEKGYEFNYQCTSIFPRWFFEINAGKEVNFNIRWIFGKGEADD